MKYRILVQCLDTRINLFKLNWEHDFSIFGWTWYSIMSVVTVVVPVTSLSKPPPVPSGCHLRKAGELEGLIQCMASFSDAGIPDQSVLTNKFDFLMKFLDDHAGSTWNIWWKWGKEDWARTFSRHCLGLYQDKLQASTADPVPVHISFSYKPRWHRIWKQYCISFYPGQRNHPEHSCVYSHWWNKGSDCSLWHCRIPCKTMHWFPDLLLDRSEDNSSVRYLNEGLVLNIFAQTRN